MDNNEIVKLVLSGKYTKYKEDIHVPLLIEVLSSVGGSIAGFCAKASIAKPTFYDWLENNPNFRSAYEVALPIAEANWINLPLSRPDIPLAYWTTRMRNQFGYGKKVLPKADRESVISKINSAWSAYSIGDITAQDYTNVVSACVSELKVRALANSQENSNPSVGIQYIINQGLNKFSREQIDFLRDLAEKERSEKIEELINDPDPTSE